MFKIKRPRYTVALKSLSSMSSLRLIVKRIIESKKMFLGLIDKSNYGIQSNFHVETYCLYVFICCFRVFRKVVDFPA